VEIVAAKGSDRFAAAETAVATGEETGLAYPFSPRLPDRTSRRNPTRGKALILRRLPGLSSIATSARIAAKPSHLPHVALRDCAHAIILAIRLKALMAAL
jgi:hypothetical protein